MLEYRHPRETREVRTMEITIKAEPKEIAALAEALRGQQKEESKPDKSVDKIIAAIGYDIRSPKCGRDKNGIYHCFCGNCGPLDKNRND